MRCPAIARRGAIAWCAAIALTGLAGGVHAGSYEDFFTAVTQDDLAKTQALLQRGFDPNTVNPKGEYALNLALRDGMPKVARFLILWPTTKVEVRNAQDESPLMFAALKGHLELATLLIERDADVNKPGWAPLHYAATKGDVPMIELLLENDAYIDAESPNGTTPLMMAAHYGTFAAVKTLLEAGADPLLKNQLGLTAQDFANKVSRKDVADAIGRQIRARQPKASW